MVGFPKWLNSKDDYLFIKENYPREQWEPYFRALLKERFGWFYVGLADGGGIADDTHNIEIMEDGSKLQYEYRENQQSMIFSLGFTVSDIETILQEA